MVRLSRFGETTQLDRPFLVLIAFVTALSCGCVSTRIREYPPLCGPQYEQGEPRKLVDGAGNLLSVFDKILLWNPKVGSRHISPETRTAIENYVSTNGLDTTKVRFNQYDPKGEWKRLRQNTGVPPIMRFTFGTFATLGYTLFPGRVLGTDNYNPYTDTLSIYSDVPELGMVEAAFAKDVHSRTHRGWYLFGQSLPILGMQHEGKATRDVIDYYAMRGDDVGQRQAFEILYPRYAGQWGSTIGSFLPRGDWIGQVAGTVAGHAVGRYEANQIGLDGEVMQTSYASYPDSEPHGNSSGF